MRSHLLALFQFTICITPGFSQNLRSFVLILHDQPLKVEETALYSLVKKWRTPEDVQEAIEMSELPDAHPLYSSESESVRFFKQQLDSQKPEARLLCWGEVKEKVGYFSFKLPEVVSTRFISLVATGVHSTYGDGDESVNVDIMKFIPHGAIVPCL